MIFAYFWRANSNKGYSTRISKNSIKHQSDFGHLTNFKIQQLKSIFQSSPKSNDCPKRLLEIRVKMKIRNDLKIGIFAYCV